jgi:hypothetical protein
VDTCHVVGTVHFYKYFPPIRFPMTSVKTKALPLPVYPSTSRLAVVFPQRYLVDKHTTDVCRQTVPPAMPFGQVHESWEHYHSNQVHIPEMYLTTKFEKINREWKLYKSTLKHGAYSVQLLAHTFLLLQTTAQ